MLRNDYTQQHCSIARSLEVIGERWTLLILRDVFLGLRRFDAIQADLGIARNVLQSRLQRLVEHGVLEKAAYQQRPARYEYRLTEKGKDLWPTISALMRWGDRHMPSPDGPPTILVHRDCGGALDDDNVCSVCGIAATTASQVRALPGPGATDDHPLRLREQRKAAAEAGG